MAAGVADLQPIIGPNTAGTCTHIDDDLDIQALRERGIRVTDQCTETVCEWSKTERGPPEDATWHGCHMAWLPFSSNCKSTEHEVLDVSRVCTIGGVANDLPDQRWHFTTRHGIVNSWVSIIR